jgi:hypothetical protein
VLSQCAQALLNVLQMFLLDFFKYEDVIHIYYQKEFCEWLQFIIHHLHECGRDIGKSKRHDQPLKETLFILKWCLPYISFLN